MAGGTRNAWREVVVGSRPAGGAAAPFDRFAGFLAIGAGLAGLGYAISFVVLKIGLLAGLFLLLAPLLATAPLVAVYRRLRDIEPGLALWALLLGVGGALGAIAHGGWDLAIALHPATGSDVPFYADPRGLFTFGLSGVALLAFAWLIGRASGFPGWVSPVGYLLGIVLIVTYLGRLIVLDATSPLVLGPALVAGILSPLFYLGLGAWLLRED